LGHLAMGASPATLQSTPLPAPFQPTPGLATHSTPGPIPHSPVQVTVGPLPVHAANTAISALLGEFPTTTPPSISRSIRNSAPLGSHLPLRLKQKIWSGQFLDLASLLPQAQVDDDECDAAPKPKRPKPPPLSIAQFVSAFHIYISVTAEQFPHLAAPMIKHLSIVQKLSENFGDEAWRHYDQQFRWAKQHNLNASWGDMDLEIYTEASLLGIKASTLKPKAFPPKRFHSGPQNSNFRPGTCWTFQSKGYCDIPNCRFRSTHSCHKCKGRHATSQCRGPNKQLPNPNSPQPQGNNQSAPPRHNNSNKGR